MLNVAKQTIVYGAAMSLITIIGVFLIVLLSSTLLVSDYSVMRFGGFLVALAVPVGMLIAFGGLCKLVEDVL